MISVVVPVYNVEKYLEKCIESICGQTYQNLEIILVDDGSTDRSGQMCDLLAKKDARITVIHQKNAGLSMARNAGIDIAKGELIAFVDSDDYIHPQMYEILEEIIVENNVDIAIGGLMQIPEEVTPPEWNKEYKKGGFCEVISGVEALFHYYDQKSLQSVVAWNKLYRRQLFEGIRYPEGKVHEDEFTTHLLLFNSERVAYIDYMFYFYVQRNNSITMSVDAKRFKNRFEATERQIEFFEKNELTELALKAKERWLCYARADYNTIRKSGIEKEVYDKTVWEKYRLFQRHLECGKRSSFREKVGNRLFIFSPRLYHTIFSLIKKRKNLNGKH